MNLASIPQLYRNAKRWREILTVLGRHGLADLLSRFDRPLRRHHKGDDGESRPGLRREERLRRALEELGPTFIKLGQLLATRPDQVGVELAEELSKLQTAAPADPFGVVRRTVEEDLGRTIEECFARFDETPVASASIGQVHRAWLADGTALAVKVRHPGIEAVVRVDSEILKGLADLAERAPDLAPYRPRATVEEFERTLRRELDLSDELRRVERFREVFDGDQRLRIPRPYPELSGRRVLTLEWLDGRKLSDPPAERTPDAGADDEEFAEERRRAARNGAQVFLEMIFEHGLYHADPHPGNLMVLPGGVIGLLDFGMVGRLSDALRDDLEETLVALAADDPAQLTASLLRIGSAPAELDERAFSADIIDFVDHYGHQRMDAFDLAGALTELFRIVRRYRVALPPQIAMLLRLLILLEGSAQKLQPDFSLVEALAPLQRRMALRRLSPVRHVKRIGRLYSEAEQLAEELPRRLRDLLNQFQSGRFEVHLEHGGLEPSVNRLVLGLLTSALIVAAAMMVSSDVLPVCGVSAPGVLAFALSAALGLRLVLAIRKSGWLDSH